jgi:glycolate oxidase FAD binding subunit
LSGPRRPYAGAARDFVLGTNIINGNGQALSFGGRVMKNVAGYDLSRLMVGAMGTLGVITEVSLKVLPMPQQEITLQFELDSQAAIKQCSTWSGETLPVTATCIQGDTLLIRLSGSDEALQSARQKMGGEFFSDENFWDSLREQTHPYFNLTDNLWRLSVAPATAPLAIEGDWLIEWGGGQRWLKTELDEQSVRNMTKQAGGHATLFDKTTGKRHLQKLDDALLLLQKRLKKSLDPENILNPGALYPEL